MADSFLYDHPSNGPIQPSGGGKGGSNPLMRFHRWQKDNPQFMPTVAAAFNNLSTRRSPVLQQHAALAQRDQLERVQARGVANRTADRIEQMGYPQYADFVRENPSQAGAVLKAVFDLGNREKIAPMTGAQYLQKNGIDPSTVNPEFLGRVLSVGDQSGEAKVLGGGGQTINVGGEKTSPGLEAYQKEIAKSVVDWQSARPVFQANIERLELGMQSLIDGEAKTGTLFGNLPGLLQKMYDEPTSQTVSLVQEAVGSSLREVLGAQFAKKEGERILNNAIDPRLSPEQNMQRISILIAQMKNAATAKDEYMQAFFDTQGTMQGFRPSIPAVTANGIIEAMGGEVGGVGQGFGDGSLSSREEEEELRRLEELELASQPPNTRRRR